MEARIGKLRRGIRGKKGAIASMGEIGFSLVLFVLIVIIFFLFNGYFNDGRMNAKMEAENAAFTCANNLNVFMNYEVPGKGMDYETLLLDAYTSNDFSEYGIEVAKVFRKYSRNNWTISVVNATGPVWSYPKVAFDVDNTESCEYRLAVPCVGVDDCGLRVELALDYRSENSFFVDAAG